MTKISNLALWGAWLRFAKRAPKPNRKPRQLPRLSTKLARDIGLSDADQERLHINWPSDGPDRPLL